MEKEIAVQTKKITKYFGKVCANNRVDFTLYKGEILSLLGENGSGKTSLMNIISGIYKQDRGDVYINGELATINSPKDAFKYRIGMIHQHFKLVDVFSATQNVVLGLGKEEYKSFRQAALESQNEKFEKIRAEGREPNEEEIANFKRLMKSTRGFNLKESKIRIQRICDKFGFKLDPDKKVYQMSVSEKQTLEIVKVLYRGCDILILDEPTAVLTPQEIKTLFDVLRNMREAGKSIIIITHKLNEVMEISDRVAVLRKGEFIGAVNTKDTNEKELTDMMVGQKMDLKINRPEPKNCIDRLFVKNITTYNKEGRKVLKNVSFTVKSGEILGIAGIAGSGQRELLESIAGINFITSGKVIFQNPKKNQPVTFFHKKLKRIKELAKNGDFHYEDGSRVVLDGMNDKEISKLVNEGKILFNEDEIVDLKDKNPQQIRELGIRLSFVPEDRLGMGLVGSMNITDNMMLRSYRKGKGMFLNRKTPEHLAQEIVDELEVVTPSLNTSVKKLSGGNIQKVLVGREIAFTPKVLMAAYPVRGLDINSSYAIYNLLNKQKERGTAVIFVGEDLDVLLALSDRLLVMCDGQVSGIVDPKTTTKDQVGLLMTTVGGKKGGN